MFWYEVKVSAFPYSNPEPLLSINKSSFGLLALGPEYGLIPDTVAYPKYEYESNYMR